MKKHWFYREGSTRKLWVAGGIILFLTVVAEFFVKLHPHFAIEEWFSFHAIFGFLSCVVMVVFAKLLGFLIKRKDDYYDDV